MTVKPNKMMLTRIAAVMLVLIIALSVVSTGSLVNIMIINGEKYQNDASEQQLYDSLVTAPRGDIYDRNMQTLATSSPAWTVYITPNGIRSIKKAEDAEKVKKKIAEAEKKGIYEYVFVEAALLIEAGYDSICEEFWYVYVPEEERIKRLMSSRGYSRKKCLDIMANQLSDEEFRKHCRYVIDNSSDSQTLIGRLEAVLKEIKSGGDRI